MGASASSSLPAPQPQASNAVVSSQGRSAPVGRSMATVNTHSVPLAGQPHHYQSHL